MKQFKLFSVVVLMLMCLTTLTSCHKAAPNADEEAVLTYQPVMWGHGGVDPEPISTGLTWCWFSTKVDTFKIVPVKNQVDMEDLVSNDNTPLDFHTVIITQIVNGKTPILLQNYGKNWFSINLYNHYCNRVRDYVSQHSPFDLMSNREVLNGIDKKVLKEMQDYVAELSKEKEFPVIIKNVIIGRAIPNAEQLEEMNKTAKAVQAKQTQEREAEVQLSRERVERLRAQADKAYREELGLSVDQLISLKWIETIAGKQGANIDVLVGDNTSHMWNVRR